MNRTEPTQTLTTCIAGTGCNGTSVMLTLPPASSLPPVATMNVPGLSGGNKLKLPS